jgi:hypothetical protein
MVCIASEELTMEELDEVAADESVHADLEAATAALANGLRHDGVARHLINELGV